MELRFTFRGELYRVNQSGHICANGLSGFSPTWVFLGGSRHHWSNRINVTLADAFANPETLNGCLGWDLDHGTTRRWGGCWNGKVPRISGAYVVKTKGAV